MIIDLKLYELANKSYSLFSNGMQKYMKSLLIHDDIQLEMDTLQSLCWSYGPVIKVERFFML